jgi:protein SCO1/2
MKYSAALCSILLALSHPVAAATAALPGTSLYQIQSRWTSDEGAALRLESLRGKPRVFTLFFGHCQTACPMVLSTLKNLEASLSPESAHRAGIVLVALDPERDDADSLAAFRTRMSLRPGLWTLLRGNAEDTRELAMALGVSYRRSAKNGGLEHDAVIAVLDGEGRVVARHEGTVDASVLRAELLAQLPAL